MTTQEKAYIAPILQTIANKRVINNKALKIDLYYIPRFKGTQETLEYDIELTQIYYSLSRSDSRDFQPTIGSGALIKLYVDHDIYVTPVTSDLPVDHGCRSYIVIPFTTDYNITIGI